MSGPPTGRPRQSLMLVGPAGVPDNPGKLACFRQAAWLESGTQPLSRLPDSIRQYDLAQEERAWRNR